MVFILSDNICKLSFCSLWKERSFVKVEPLEERFLSFVLFIFILPIKSLFSFAPILFLVCNKTWAVYWSITEILLSSVSVPSYFPPRTYHNQVKPCQQTPLVALIIRIHYEVCQEHWRMESLYVKKLFNEAFNE